MELCKRAAVGRAGLALLWVVIANACVAQGSNWLDFRYDFNARGDLYYYVEYAYTKNKLVFPDIVYLKLPQFAHHETEVGLDYTFYASQQATHQISLLPTWATGNVRHMLYCITSSWSKNRWDANAFCGYVGKLNKQSSEFWLVDPAVLRYRVAKKWRVGLNFTGTKSRHSPWERALGLSLTYDDRLGSWEIRAGY